MNNKRDKRLRVKVPKVKHINKKKSGEPRHALLLNIRLGAMHYVANWAVVHECSWTEAINQIIEYCSIENAISTGDVVREKLYRAV